MSAGGLSRFSIRLTTIAAVGVAWRIFYVWQWKGGDTNLVDEGDAFYYGPQAITNASGRFFQHPWTGQEAADHPPVTALLLTPISWFDGVFGAQITLAQRLVMVAVGAGVIVLIGVLGRRVGGDRLGLIAAALAAVHAALWLNDSVLMPEGPAALLVVLALLVALDLHDDVSIRRAALLGIVVGFATLTRAELVLLFPLLFAVPLSRSDRSAGELVRASAAGLAALALVLAPWVGWNLARFERPTFVSTNDGVTLVGANCPTTYHGNGLGFWDIHCALDHPAPGDQSEVSAAWRDRGLDYIGDNLDRLPTVMATRVARVWGIYRPAQMVYFNQGEGRESWASWVAMYQSWVLFPVAIVGGVVLWRRRQPVAPYIATAVLVTLTAALFYGIVRFHVPADVAMVVLAAVAVDAGLGHLGNLNTARSRRGAPAPG